MPNCLESCWPQKILPDSNLRRHRLCLVSLFLTPRHRRRWALKWLRSALYFEKWISAGTGILEIGTFIGAVRWSVFLEKLRIVLEFFPCQNVWPERNSIAIGVKPIKANKDDSFRNEAEHFWLLSEVHVKWNPGVCHVTVPYIAFCAGYYRFTLRMHSSASCGRHMDHINGWFMWNSTAWTLLCPY